MKDKRKEKVVRKEMKWILRSDADYHLEEDIIYDLELKAAAKVMLRHYMVPSEFDDSEFNV